MLNKKKRIIRRIIIGVLITFFIIGLTILIVYLVLQPKKPRFVLEEATLYTFNLTTLPYFLSSNFQLTISSHNRNGKIGIYYDKLDIYATYRGQQITYYTVTLPIFQDTKEVTIWSPFVYGNNIPLAPYMGRVLTQEQASGAIWLMFKINGRVRWKVGSTITRRYHLHVNCAAYIPFGNTTGIDPLWNQLPKDCKVSV